MPNMPAHEVNEDEIRKVDKWGLIPKDNLPSLENLLIGIHNKNLNRIKLDSIEEYKALNKRQEEVAFLHKLIGAINAATNDKGEVDLTNTELVDLLAKAKEMGINMPDMKFKDNKLTNTQRDQLISTIRMTVDDENTLIELHMQKISNLNYELHESYQWMRTHIKALDDIKRKMASRIDIHR